MTASKLSGKKPLVTVVTVVRNGAAEIEATMQSVFSSGYPNLDYVVIDGGSTDGTAGIVRRYADRLSYFVSEPDRGIYDAMNKGWAAAREEGYVLFLGAGDRLLSLPPDLGSFGPNDVLYGEVKLGSRIFRPQAGLGLRCNNTLHHQALLVPKSLHPSPPFDLRFRVYADFDFNQRLLKRGAQFVYSGGFKGYALPGGLSSRKAHCETLAIVAKNFGVAWALFAFCYLAFAKISALFSRREAVGVKEAP